jgi:hypothetical protein
MRNIKSAQERQTRSIKQQQKLNLGRNRKQRKYDLQRHRAEQERAAQIQEQQAKVRAEDGARTIQKLVRERNGHLMYLRQRVQTTSAMALQKVFRGYIACRRAKEKQSIMERKRKNKIAKWQAWTTVVIYLVRWLKRSRDRRWRSFMHAVKTALEMEPHHSPHFEHQCADASPGTSAPALSNHAVNNNKPNALRVSRKKRGHTPHHRRESSVSAITAYSDGPGRGANVQRLSVVETDDANTLAIEIFHIASKVTTVIKIEHFIWARLGKGRLEDMSDDDRDDTCRTLLDCCLMQTGRMSAMSLFDNLPTLRDFFTSLMRVTPAYLPSSVPKSNVMSMAEIIAQRLRIHVAKKGKVVYEHGTIGKISQSLINLVRHALN